MRTPHLSVDNSIIPGGCFSLVPWLQFLSYVDGELSRGNKLGGPGVQGARRILAGEDRVCTDRRLPAARSQNAGMDKGVRRPKQGQVDYRECGRPASADPSGIACVSFNGSVACVPTFGSSGLGSEIHRDQPCFRSSGTAWLRLARCTCGWHGYLMAIGVCPECKLQLSWVPLG